MENNSSNSVRALLGVAGIVPIGVALLLLGRLWGGILGIPLLAEGLAGSVLFRLLGTLVSVGFLAVGSFFLLMAIRRPKSARPVARHLARSNYRCPSCGASMEGNAEISPEGDIKCEFCKGLFNIHAKG